MNRDDMTEVLYEDRTAVEPFWMPAGWRFGASFDAHLHDGSMLYLAVERPGGDDGVWCSADDGTTASQDEWFVRVDGTLDRHPTDGAPPALAVGSVVEGGRDE